MSRCVEPHFPRSQRGVALITMLLVFVLATMMATHMLRTSYLAMHRTGNLIDSTQARYYAYGAEELGRQMLAVTPAQEQQGRVDHLGQEWAQEKLSFEIEDGVLELKVVDEAGRFNLNSLADAMGQPDAQATARFASLLGALRLDPMLAERVADWIDKDTLTSRGGQEQAAYGTQAIPNLPFAETSELLAIPGFDAQAWSLLEPEVSALPSGTLLNINTATALTLGAYAGGASRSDLERFVHTRKLQPVKSTSEPAVAALFAQTLAQLDVKSDFFLVSTHAEYRGRHVRLNTLLRRDARSGKLEVLGRSDAARL